jgi:hypothetical protein
MAHGRKEFTKQKNREERRGRPLAFARSLGEAENGAGRREPRESHPATQHHDPKRYVGTVVRIIEDKGFSFIKDGENREYFAHKSVYSPPELWDDAIAASGTLAVSFYRTETTKGWRAAGVRLADATERESIEASDENRGNR